MAQVNIRYIVQDVDKGGDGLSMADETQPTPGGWNQFRQEADGVDVMVEQLQSE